MILYFQNLINNIEAYTDCDDRIKDPSFLFKIAALVEQRKAIAQTYTSSSIDKVEDLSFVEELSSELPQDNVTLEKPRQLTLNNQTKRIK